MVSIKMISDIMTREIKKTSKFQTSEAVVRTAVDQVLEPIYAASLLTRDDSTLHSRPITDYQLDSRFSTLILAQEVVFDLSRNYANLIEPYELGTSEGILGSEVTPADFKSAQDQILNFFKAKSATFDSAITRGVMTLSQVIDEVAFKPSKEGQSNMNCVRLTRLPVYVKGVNTLLQSWNFGTTDETLVENYILDVVLPALRNKPNAQ